MRSHEIHLSYLFFPMLCTLQMGYSYYISVQAILFVYLLSKVPVSFYIKSIFLLFPLFLLIVTPALFFDVPEQLNSVLNSFRQFVCLAVLVVILKETSLSVEDGNKKLLVLLTLFILFITTVIQAIGLNIGLSLTPPASLLVANAGTLEAMQFAASLGMTEDLRPSAFYGEPSYLAFICISLLFVAYSWRNSGRDVLYASILSLGVVVVSRSLSAFLAYVILTSVYFFSKNRMSMKLIIGIMLFTLVGLAYVVLYDGASWIVTRLSGIVSMDSDRSSALRLFTPFFLISIVLQDYPFGVPSLALGTVFGRFFEDDSVMGTDNGLLNLVINFGYSGLVVILFIIIFCRKNALLLTYVLLASMFNGAFLSIDKIAVVGFAILLSRAYSSERSFNHAEHL